MRLVNTESLHVSIETAEIGGKIYTIFPPDTERLDRAGELLGELGEAQDIRTLIMTAEPESRKKALAVLLGEKEDTFDKADDGEVAVAIVRSLSFTSMNTAVKMINIVRNISSLVARKR